MSAKSQNFCNTLAEVITGRFTMIGRGVAFLAEAPRQESAIGSQDLAGGSGFFFDTGIMSSIPGSGPLDSENGVPPGAGGLCRESVRPVTAEQLARVEFFRGLSPGRLALIARYSKRCHFEKGEVLFREGEIANCFYVINSGRVGIEFSGGGRAVPVQEIGPGQPVGFSWFFNPENLHFSAHALEPVEAIFFFGTMLREDCEIDHELGYELMRRTSEVMLQRLEALAGILSKALAEKSPPAK